MHSVSDTVNTRNDLRCDCCSNSCSDSRAVPLTLTAWPWCVPKMKFVAVIMPQVTWSQRSCALQHCLLSVKGSPPMCALSYARMTLTLTAWPRYSTLTQTFWRWTCAPKVNFVSQIIQKWAWTRHAGTFFFCDLDLDTMTLVYELRILKMYRIPKVKFPGQDFQNLEPAVRTDTHRHTDRCDRTHYHTAFAGENIHEAD